MSRGSSSTAGAAPSKPRCAEIEATDNARVVTATGYDEMGLVRYAMPEFANPNTGTAGFSEPVNPTITNIDHYSLTDYDALGRATQTLEKSNGTTLATTTFGYDGNRSWTVPPVGGRTQTETDGWGRPLKVTQFQDTAGTTLGHDASYTYTGTGALDTITALVNGATRTWDYDYDQMGRRTKSTDPDVGVTLSTYDANNNPITVDDPVAPVVTTTYDVLNRPTSRQAAGATAPDATWTYDTGATNATGRLVSATTVTGLGLFTNRVDTYDARGNPTQVTTTFPANFVTDTPLPASLSTTYTYNELGLPKTTAYTALPGLPASTVTTDYTRYGNLRSITTPGATIAQATYNKLNHTTNLVSRDPGPTGSALERIYGWDLTTGRLAQLKTTNNIPTGTTGSVNHLTLDYTYDKIGNPLRIVGTTQDNATAAGQTGAWCYTYDWSNRLDTARVNTPITTAGASTCNTTTGTNAAVLAATGTQPYAVDYNYTRDALDTVTSLGATAGSVKYNYPTSGTAFPHRLNNTALTGTKVAGLPDPGAMIYDAAGRITKWTPAGGTAINYTYDTNGNLTNTGPTAATATSIATKHAYTADGIRIARETKVGATPATLKTTTVVYLGDTEVTRTATGTAVGTLTSRRTYTTPGGMPLAQQQSTYVAGNGVTPTWTWLSADTQNALRITKTNTATPTTTKLNYYPHGAPVTPTTNLPGEHGYLNKTHDPGGDIRLDHRTYNPTLNTLTTPDPLLVPGDPQSLNPYTYSRNNPITLTDPTGLDPLLENGQHCNACYDSPFADFGSGAAGGSSGSGSDDETVTESDSSMGLDDEAQELLQAQLWAGGDMMNSGVGYSSAFGGWDPVCPSVNACTEAAKHLDSHAGDVRGALAAGLSYCQSHDCAFEERLAGAMKATFSAVVAVGMVKSFVGNLERSIAANTVPEALSFGSRAAAREGLPGDLVAVGNRFFRGATSKSQDFQAIGLPGGGYRLQFFSPANNPGYGKLYVQEIDRGGNIVSRYKDTMGPNGFIERKFVQ